MKSRIIAASALSIAGLTAGAPAFASNPEPRQVGLVNVEVGNLNVTVPVNAAVAIAANVCNIDLTTAILGQVFAGNPFEGTCDSNSQAFNDQELSITQTKTN